MSRDSLMAGFKLTPGATPPGGRRFFGSDDDAYLMVGDIVTVRAGPPLMTRRNVDGSYRVVCNGATLVTLDTLADAEEWIKDNAAN